MEKEISVFDKDNKSVKENLSTKENNQFTFDLSDVDIFEDSNTVWFCLSDIGKLLDLSESSVRMMRANKWFDDDEVKVSKKLTSSTGQLATYISESALYRILNRTNSPKAKPFERWVTKEVIPSIRKTGTYTIQHPSKSDKELEIIEKQAGLERAKFLESLADKYDGKSETYVKILDAYAAKEIAGEFILPLPQLSRKTYSATEVGKMLGISAQKVGSIANRLNIKTDEYGQYFVDKSKYSNKEIDVFRYYDNAIELIKQAI